MPSEDCDPSLPSPSNPSEPRENAGWGQVQIMLQGTLSMTYYPQLKKLSGSVAKQPQLTWERIGGPQGRLIQSLY